MALDYRVSMLQEAFPSLLPPEMWAEINNHVAWNPPRAHLVPVIANKLVLQRIMKRDCETYRIMCARFISPSLWFCQLSAAQEKNLRAVFNSEDEFLEKNPPPKHISAGCMCTCCASRRTRPYNSRIFRGCKNRPQKN